MTTERVNRRHRQKKTIKALREIRDITSPYSISSNTICEVSIEVNSGDNILNEFVQNQQLELNNFSTPITVTTEEADVLLMELRSQWNEQQLNLLLGNCRNSVLSSIVGPFGLGTIIASLDKDGGNITTVHNAESGIFSKSKDRDRYDIAYDHKDYEDGGFNPKRKELFKQNNKVIDAYTGTETPKDGQTHLDHVISAKKIHDDKLLRLSTDIQKRDKIATNKKNLVPTNSSLNQSKNDHDLIEWMNTPNLKLKDGTTNAEYYNVDINLANDVYKIAKRQYQLEKTLAVSQHYGSEIAVTGIQEGAKMGYQQSLGLLLTEFFSASFDEIIDSYKNGFSDSLTNPSFFEALHVRLTRISTRVAARWKDALVAFKDGALSGFLSNLITMLINLLITTGKRIVRVIREGFMSIMKALKMMMFPPEGMTNYEAADAALKLLATGVTVSLGVLAEEVVEKSISAFFAANIPFLAPYAGSVSAVFVGAMTGIASALLVYGLDKLDIFDVINQRKHEFVLKDLDDLIAKSDNNNDLIYQDEMNRLDNMLIKLQGA